MWMLITAFGMWIMCVFLFFSVDPHALTRVPAENFLLASLPLFVWCLVLDGSLKILSSALRKILSLVLYISLCGEFIYSMLISQRLLE